MGRPKQAARDIERDGCLRAFNAKKIKINNSRMGKQRKTKTDESQVVVLESASRGSWEGCRLCWGPGCAAGRDEMRADK